MFSHIWRPEWTVKYNLYVNARILIKAEGNPAGHVILIHLPSKFLLGRNDNRWLFFFHFSSCWAFKTTKWIPEVYSWDKVSWRHHGYKVSKSQGCWSRGRLSKCVLQSDAVLLLTDALTHISCCPFINPSLAVHFLRLHIYPSSHTFSLFGSSSQISCRPSAAAVGVKQSQL